MAGVGSAGMDGCLAGSMLRCTAPDASGGLRRGRHRCTV